MLFERDINRYGKEDFEKITVTRIPHDMLAKLWIAYKYKSEANPGWFYTRHAPYLLRSNGCICDPRGCVTQLRAKSTSYVYSVSLPKIFQNVVIGGQRIEVIGATAVTPDIAIKVVECPDEYTAEVSALRAVVPEYNKIDSSDWGILRTLP